MRFPVETLGKIEKSEALTLGMSGAAVHAVTTARGAYVMRVAGDEAAFARSLPFWLRAAEHRVAPRIVHVDEAARGVVSERITGTFVGREAFGSLVQQLRALRAIPVDGLPGAKNPAEGARELWRVQSARPGFPAWARGCVEAIDAASEMLARDGRRVVGHGDLNPGNMLWDGQKVWFVDWDQASLAHPCLDAAIVSVFMNLDEATSRVLLENATDAAALSCLRELARVVYGCVFLSLVDDLRTVSMPALADAPTLAECYAELSQGRRRHERMACALLGQCSSLSPP